MIKENDVFYAYYTEKYRNGAGKGWDLNHCFEGLLVAMIIGGNIELVDTFWGVKRADEYNKRFKLDDVGEKIDITFYCNLDEIEKSSRGKQTELYYNEGDYFILHDQHACSENCKQYFIKKGAQISKEKLLESIKYKIEREESKINSANWSIESLKRDMEKVNNDELENIYI